MPRDNSVAAVDLQSLIDDSLGCFGCEEFRDRRFHRQTRLPLVVRRSGLVDQKARRFQICRHLGELELNALKFADRATELLSSARIRNGFSQSSSGETDGTSPNCTAKHIKCLQGEF